MQYALTEKGERVLAEIRGQRAACPGCSSSVMSKVGDVVRPHWAHLDREDCDTWSEGMTDWHAGWQAEFPKECREVWIPPHRADVLTHTGVVVEFQHSPITWAEMAERERFYRANVGGGMLWLFDMTEQFGDGRIKLTEGDDLHGIMLWEERPPIHIPRAKEPVYLDIGNGTVLECVKMRGGGTGGDASAPSWQQPKRRQAWWGRVLVMPRGAFLLGLGA